MCGNARTAQLYEWSDETQDESLEIYMYLGGGILGTILFIALIIFVLNRV
jgi:O-antigen ligase